MTPFRSPLGLVLSGGGAHGAWQAGALKAFAEAGLRFDRVLGVSIGSISGAAYFLNEVDKAIEFWRDIDSLRIMRLDPRLSPFSLFSGAPLWEALRYIEDEERWRRRARCHFTVVTLCRDDGRHHYARFSPAGQAPWDGPLVDKLIASCSVPVVFPPVRLRVDGLERTFVDGAALGRDWMTYNAAMEGCADVLVLELVRPEQIGGFHPLKRLRGDPLGKDLVYALEALKSSPVAPRVFRLYPSAPLAFSQFRFRSRECAGAVERGTQDGRAFLSSPEAFAA